MQKHSITFANELASFHTYQTPFTATRYSSQDPGDDDEEEEMQG